MAVFRILLLSTVSTVRFAMSPEFGIIRLQNLSVSPSLFTTVHADIYGRRRNKTQILQ